MESSELSLVAELQLLAIDPADGGLLPRHRRRFRRAMAAARAIARGSGRASAWAARRARRRAIAELTQAGLVERGGPFGRIRLADRAQAAQRLNRLRRCIRDGEFPDPRDRELLFLLAWTHVLGRQLSKDERRLALRRLEDFFSLEPEWITALGSVPELTRADLFVDADHVDFGRDQSGFQAGPGV